TRVPVAPGLVLQGLAQVGHVVYLPVMRPTGQSFGGDPGLRATVALSQQGLSGPVYNGSWSSSNRSYVIYFQAPSVGMYDVAVSLQHPVEQLTQATILMRLDASQPPLAVNGSLDLATSYTRVGDWAYLTATLLDVAGQPAPSTVGVSLTAFGAYSGAADLQLAPAAEGVRLWRARYNLTMQESVTFTLLVAGNVVDSKPLEVLGVAPEFLDIPSSLAAARLYNVLGGTTATTTATATSGANTTTNTSSSSSSSTAVSSAAVSPDSALMVPVAQQVTLEVPVFTKAGAKWLSDPGLSVVLSLVPSAIEEDISSEYAAALQTTVRRLLRATGHGGGGYGDVGSSGLVGGSEGEDDEEEPG
ncbi:hypothetical protein Agub_g9274, partial [Astrephomene gubernaculifera]